MQLPADFIRETRQVMGEERFNRFMGAFEEEAPVSIRLNPLKMSQRDGSFVTSTISQKNRPSVTWCPEGFYLEGRPQFTFDPLFHAGCYYVQEASSMFVTHVLRSLFTVHSSLLLFPQLFFDIHHQFSLSLHRDNIPMFYYIPKTVTL